MDHRLEQDALIEDMLSAQPLEPMPRSITVDVLTRIHKENRPHLVTWGDLAVALAIVLTLGALFITVQSMPPMALAKMRIQGILLYQGCIINAHWLVPGLFFGLAAFFASFAIPPSLRMSINEKG